ncbi:MAG: SDR family NAD(P)-dependent oxidoreductase [Opitutaceae bacterium]|nr:SDR family NAD(P)-dependent oxidoreductase [Opitutaceae bacterium]
MNEKIFLTGKKVVVTGGAGFIGSHVCEELVRIGARVCCVDDYSAGHARNVDFLRRHDNFEVVRADVCDRSAMSSVVAGADVIFHNAASKKNVCLIDPQKDLRVNGGGTLNLLELAREHGVRKFVHASTGSVYGEPTVFPTDEEHPLRPVSYYGVSKLAGERYVDVFHRLYKMDTTILRYFHVYGPRQESNQFGGVVSIFLRNILEKKPLTIFGDGHQERSFTWVKDLVRANLAAATRPESAGRVYNAASGIQVTILELAERMVEMMAAPVPIVHGEPLVGDIMHFDVDNRRIRGELGVEFERDFWGTLQRTLDDFVANLRGVITA